MGPGTFGFSQKSSLSPFLFRSDSSVRHGINLTGRVSSIDQTRSARLSHYVHRNSSMFNGRCIVKQVSLALSVILVGLAITVVSCDSKKPNELAAKTGTAATAPVSDEALMSAVGSPGQADNDGFRKRSSPIRSRRKPSITWASASTRWESTMRRAPPSSRP